MDGWTDGERDRQTDRQTDRHIEYVNFYSKALSDTTGPAVYCVGVSLR